MSTGRSAVQGRFLLAVLTDRSMAILVGCSMAIRDWMFVLCRWMSDMSVRRVSWGLSIAGNYRVPTPPPFCFQYVDFSV